MWDNVGAIKNSGFDLALQTQNVRSGKPGGFEWTTDLNVTFNKNEVTELYDGLPITATVSGRVTSVAAVGQPLGTFFLYQFLRVDPATGNALYRKADGTETLAPWRRTSRTAAIRSPSTSAVSRTPSRGVTST